MRIKMATQRFFWGTQGATKNATVLSLKWGTSRFHEIIWRPKSCLFVLEGGPAIQKICRKRKHHGTKVPSRELKYPLTRHFWVDDFPFEWWNMDSFPGGYLIITYYRISTEAKWTKNHLQIYQLSGGNRSMVIEMWLTPDLLLRCLWPALTQNDYTKLNL